MSTIITLDNVYRVFEWVRNSYMLSMGSILTLKKARYAVCRTLRLRKSTLLHMMAGLDKPSKGSIMIGKPALIS